MDGDGFYPQTAREGLLQIRRLVAPGVSSGPVTLEAMRSVDQVAREALDRREPTNFEFEDELADALARAHEALRLVDAEGFADNSELEGKISEALVLSTPVEAVVERRIGSNPRRS